VAFGGAVAAAGVGAWADVEAGNTSATPRTHVAQTMR
jgi:hypothetical protein